MARDQQNDISLDCTSPANCITRGFFKEIGYKILPPFTPHQTVTFTERRLR